MVNPIEPVLKTTRTPTRRSYLVSGQDVTDYVTPSGTDSFTVTLGSRTIPQDDETFPWTVDANGDVVFTKNSPPHGELVTIIGNYDLDFNKIKFPSGYSLDARVFNRTLEDALAVANETWVESSNQYTENRERVFPAADATDDQFVIGDSNAWSKVNKTQVKNIIGQESFNVIEVDTLKAFESVSSLSLSADNTNFSILTASDVRLTASSNPANPYSNFIQRTLTLIPEEGTTSASISSDNVSGFEINANDYIGFDRIGYDVINPSGYFNARANVDLDLAIKGIANYDIDRLINARTQEDNLHLDINFVSPPRANGFYSLKNSNRGCLKTVDSPLGYAKFDYKYSLDLDDYPTITQWNELVSWNTQIRAPGSSYSLIRKEDTYNITQASPMMGIRRIYHMFLIDDGPDDSNRYSTVKNSTTTTVYKFIPAIFVEFYRSLYEGDWDNTSTLPITIQGQMRVSTERGGAASPYNNTDRDSVSMKPQMYVIGDPVYNAYAVDYNLGGHTLDGFTPMPQTPQQAADLGYSARGCAIIVPFLRTNADLYSGSIKPHTVRMKNTNNGAGTTSDTGRLSGEFIFLSNEDLPPV